MEYIDDEIKQEYLNNILKDKKPIKEYYPLIFLILITVFIVVMIVTIITLIKNIDEIKTDPLVFGMEKRGYESCSCLGDDGQLWIINTVEHNTKT